MRIEIHESVSQQPNGDRDTQRHPCHGFKVVLFNGDKKSVLFENDQFDPWWTHINGTREEYLSEAQKKAVEFSDTMGCPADLDPKLKTDTELSEELQRIQNILLGCLHEDENSTIYITFKEGQWHLITVVKTMGGVEHEVLCRHEDFLEFMELVHEYSDYVEGEEHGEEDN